MKKTQDLLELPTIKLGDIKYEIKKFVEKQNFIIVYLDNNEKLKCSVEYYFKIKNLKGIDEEIYNELIKLDLYINAYNGCLRKLSNKDYSEFQIKEYLKKFNITDIEVIDIVNKLKKFDLINDERYTISKINYYNNLSYSYNAIKFKLKLDNIDNHIIQENLIYDYSLEIEKAKNISNKYINSNHNKSETLLRKSLLSKLNNLGFSYDVCNDIINEVYIDNSNELELLRKQFNKIYNKYVDKYHGYELKNKIYISLVQKGYKTNDIKKVLEDLNE